MINFSLIYDIPSGTPEAFNVVIEIPKDSNHKYEYDEFLKCFVLDRILLPAMRYPGNYGFIPQTFSEDDDPIDVLVVNSGNIERGTIVECYPIGALDMSDDGVRDIKIIAMPTFHHRRKNYTKLEDFDPYFLQQIDHFFSHYKDLEEKEVIVNGWLDAEETKKLIQAASNEWIEEIERAKGEILKYYSENSPDSEATHTPKKKTLPGMGGIDIIGYDADDK